MIFAKVKAGEKLLINGRNGYIQICDGKIECFGGETGKNLWVNMNEDGSHDVLLCPEYRLAVWDEMEIATIKDRT